MKPAPGNVVKKQSQKNDIFENLMRVEGFEVTPGCLAVFDDVEDPRSRNRLWLCPIYSISGNSSFSVAHDCVIAQ